MPNLYTAGNNLHGVYWSPQHRRPQDYDFFKAMQPNVFKIMDGGPPDYAWAYANLPNSLIIARDWALSEQKGDMLSNPIGTGERHAQEWDQHARRLGLDRSRTLVLGINEPSIWELGVLEATRLYTIAFLDECTRLGLRAGALQLSVGWPNNNGPDTPPDWSPFHGVEEAIKRGNHALILHEYWADNGPDEMWGWWAGRALKCPWRVPIVIGECGIELMVKYADGGHRGWRQTPGMTAELYAGELDEYTRRMSADDRIIGTCDYQADFQNSEWWGFDLEPAYGAILRFPKVQRANSMIFLPIVGNGGASPQPPQPPTPTPLPEPVPDGDFFPRVMAFINRWEGGFVNHPADPGGATNMGITIGTLTKWRAAHNKPSPTVEDVKNLTRAEADSIYRAWYWEPSGAAKAKDYKTALLLMDSGVLHGVGAPQAWVNEYGMNPFRILGRRLEVYTGKDATQWGAFGRGWTNRVAALAHEMGKEG